MSDKPSKAAKKLAAELGFYAGSSWGSGEGEAFLIQTLIDEAVTESTRSANELAEKLKRRDEQLARATVLLSDAEDELRQVRVAGEEDRMSDPKLDEIAKSVMWAVYSSTMAEEAIHAALTEAYEHGRAEERKALREIVGSPITAALTEAFERGRAERDREWKALFGRGLNSEKLVLWTAATSRLSAEDFAEQITNTAREEIVRLKMALATSERLRLESIAALAAARRTDE